MWGLITSTVLDSEGDFPEDDDAGDDDFGDDIGDATVVRDGDSFETMVGSAGCLSTSGKDAGGHQGEGTDGEVAVAGNEQEATRKVYAIDKQHLRLLRRSCLTGPTRASFFS